MPRKARARLLLLLFFLAGTAWSQDKDDKNVDAKAAAKVSVDATVAIRKAEKAMGEVKSIRYSGTGTWGVLGMNWNPTSPWHTTDVSSYTRTIDYPSASSAEEVTRAQQNPPMLGGEAPFVDEIKEGLRVSGRYAWDQPV